MNSAIIALHGFLGLPSDWDILNLNQIHAFNINSFEWNDFNDWTIQFNQKIQDTFNFSIIMGYSLGGRLALHALIQNPFQWKAGIIISAHTGLKNDNLKKARFDQDQKWSRRFLVEDWETLMADWNQQDVFSSDNFHFERLEQNYNRSELAKSLVRASLGKQEDLSKKITNLPIPILWITGENDEKYAPISSSLKFQNPLSKSVMIPNVGHRVPWVQTIKFKNELIEFLTKIN